MGLFSRQGRTAFACRLATIVLPAMAVASCDPALYEVHRPKSLADAASYHVAVLAAIPFDHVRKDLRPSFSLSGDKALDKVIPTTGYLDEKLIQAFTAAIGIGTAAPTPSKPQSSASTSASTNPTNTTSQSVTVNTAPSATKPGTADGKGTDSATKSSDRPLQRDPILQYNMAMALLQEVKLLNAYIDHVEKRRSLTPYILRVNISLQPYARNQPYDAYVDLAFFNGDQSALPFVVPLLVTDNLEGLSANRSSEMITQLALAVSAMIQAVPVAGNFGFSRDHLKSIVGTDLNSVLMVSRSVDNVVKVRLGAPRQPTAEYAMIPTNHTISLLVLAPIDPKTRDDDARTLDIVTRTSLRDTKTGELVSAEVTDIYANGRAALNRIFKARPSKILTDNKSLDPFIRHLVDYIQLQDVSNFKRCLTTEFDQQIANDYWTAVWTALSETSSSSEFQSTSVVLPQIGDRPQRAGSKMEALNPEENNKCVAKKAANARAGGPQ